MSHSNHETVPTGFKLHVTHLHSGNTSRSQRKGHPYVTIAKVFNDEGVEVSRGIARCSRKDSPRRSLGRSIAVGRAIAHLENK